VAGRACPACSVSNPADKTALAERAEAPRAVAVRQVVVVANVVGGSDDITGEKS